jgi:hypothetical protein
MSEFGPSPEQEAEKETQGIVIAKEIAELRSRAQTDADYEVVLQKTSELKGLFGIASESELGKEAVESIEKAKEILGGDCLGAEAVEKTFGLKLESAKIPAIPFSATELERAKSLGQMLVLRANKGPDGKPLTMQAMNNLLKEKYKKAGSKLLYDTDWYKGEEFYTA